MNDHESWIFPGDHWVSVCIPIYLRSTDTDHAGVVPSSRVAEDHNDHEHPCHQLEDATELEQADGGGEADGQPHHHGQDSDNHRQPSEYCPCPECWR